MDGAPVPFWLQVDLARAEDDVAPYEFSQVGLPADGVLQVFADPWAVADGEPVRHRVVLVPADTLRDEALPPPRGLEPVAGTRLATTDTMATLPHEDDVPDAQGWGPAGPAESAHLPAVRRRPLDLSGQTSTCQVVYALTGGGFPG